MHDIWIAGSDYVRVLDDEEEQHQNVLQFHTVNSILYILSNLQLLGGWY